MIQFRCTVKEDNNTIKEIISVHLSIGKMLLSWDMPMRIIDWHVRMILGKVLRRMREKKFSMQKRLLFEAIPKLDSVLDITKTRMAIMREQ